MKKSQRTKTKLLSSLVLLLLSMTMFLGTTFAWFTDSVTSSGNKIQAGTLKVDLELLNEDGTTYTSVRDMQEPIFNYTLWEPGYTEVKTLKIQNEGNLALKYQLNVVAEEKSELADVIDVYMSFGEQKPTTADDLNNTSIWWLCGTLTEMMINPDGFTQGKLLPVGTNYTGTTLGQNGVAVGEITATIALHMQETAGNEYQGKDLGNIDAKLVATQYSFEEDAFGNNYDEDANYDNAFTVSTADELQVAVNNGGNIIITDDIQLEKRIIIEEGKTVSIDLGGKTVTAADDDEYVIYNNDNLTIGNGTVNGIVYTGAGGNTVIESGTYNPATPTSNFTILNSGGTLTINGGTVNGGKYYPIYSYNDNSTLVINDVKVNATFGCINIYGDKTTATAQINGGTFEMTGLENTSSHIAYFSTNSEVIINGGTFKKIGDISMSAAGGGGICTNRNAKLTVKGGNFAGDYSDIYNWGSGTISISGGNFKHKPTAGFIATGYTYTQNTDGTYTVQ